MQKKWIAGIIIVVIIIGTIFIYWRMNKSIDTIKQDCLTATEPQLKVPIQVFEGTIFTVLVCGINPSHTYQLRENNYITTDIWFTGVNHSFIPLSSAESSFLDDGTLTIKLWDNTTQTIIDEKMIVLVKMGGIPCDFLIMLAIPIIIILIIVGVVVKLIGILKKWNYL